MEGIGFNTAIGTMLHDGKVAQAEYFTSAVSDGLVRQYIAQHPGSIDPTNLTTWYDLSQKNSNATIFNSPSYDGYSFNLNGTNQFATYTWPADLNPLSFSFEFWITPTNASDIYLNGASGFGGTSIRLLNLLGYRYINFVLSTTSGNMFFSSKSFYTPYVEGTVEHIVCARNNDRLKIYHQGLELPTGSESGFYTADLSFYPNTIGRYIGSYFPGKIYYFALYNRALNSEEASKNYQQNKSRFE